MYFSAVCITNIKGLWSLLGEQVEDFLSVGDSVGNSQVFVPAAQLCTDIIQSNSLVAITLQGQNPEGNFILASQVPEKNTVVSSMSLGLD